MPFSRDHGAGAATLLRLLQSPTQFRLLKRQVIQFSNIPNATCNTPHRETSPAASTAEASNTFQSQEPSSRDLHAGSDPMRVCRILGEAILNPFRTLPQTSPNVQSASTLSTPRQKKFPNPSTFVLWEMIFRSEVCSGNCHPSYAMICISEIIPQNQWKICDSSEFTLEHHVPKFDTLDATIANALKKTVAPSDFRKNMLIEEQMAQDENRLLPRKRQSQVSAVSD